MNFEVKFAENWTCTIRENQIHIGYWDNDIQILNGKAFNNMKDFRAYLDTNYYAFSLNIRAIFENQYLMFQEFFKIMKKMGEE